MTVENKIKNENSTKEVIELKELFASLSPIPEEKRPVSLRLRTILKQLNLELEIDSALENNRYLKKLVTECRLFLPEVFQWKNYWEYSLTYQVENYFIKCELDLIVSSEGEIIILDWSGVENNPLLPIKLYLLCLKLNLLPSKVRVVGLLANSLEEDRQIHFDRHRYYSNDITIAKQVLEEALERLERGLPDFIEPSKEPSIEEIIKELETIPEVEI